MNPSNNELHAHYNNRLLYVFEYIDHNLDADLSLKEIAAIAFFSPFHFHRIFKLITQETLNEYVHRKRIEKAALDILHSNCTATQIAHKYCFSDISSFSRAFKKYYGVSPTIFKKEHPYKHSKIRQLKSKIGQEYPNHDTYICNLESLKNWILMNATIEIKEIATINLAYVACLGPQNLEKAYHKLLQWAIPKGVMQPQSKMVTIYHDSFKVTAPQKVRMSACLILEKKVETADGIGLTTIKQGKCIVGHFEIGLKEFEKSWTGLFLWMNEQGYQKSDREPFEIYHNNFNDHPEKKAIVDFYIPIKS